MSAKDNCIHQQNLMAIESTVAEIFHFGPKWWTDRLTDMVIHTVMQLKRLKYTYLERNLRTTPNTELHHNSETSCVCSSPACQDMQPPCVALNEDGDPEEMQGRRERSKQVGKKG